MMLLFCIRLSQKHTPPVLVQNAIGPSNFLLRQTFSSSLLCAALVAPAPREGMWLASVRSFITVDLMPSLRLWF